MSVPIYTYFNISGALQEILMGIVYS